MASTELIKDDRKSMIMVRLPWIEAALTWMMGNLHQLETRYSNSLVKR